MERKTNMLTKLTSVTHGTSVVFITQGNDWRQLGEGLMTRMTKTTMSKR
jgi:hypothetical protein